MSKGSVIKCPDCPDGYVWTDKGPTDKPCLTCGGEGRVLLVSLGSLTPSSLDRRMAAAARVPPKKKGEPEKQITADCYGAHTINWSGGATPRRKPAP